MSATSSSWNLRISSQNEWIWLLEHRYEKNCSIHWVTLYSPNILSSLTHWCVLGGGAIGRCLGHEGADPCKWGLAPFVRRATRERAVSSLSLMASAMKGDRDTATCKPGRALGNGGYSGTLILSQPPEPWGISLSSLSPPVSGMFVITAWADNYSQKE